MDYPQVYTCPRCRRRFSACAAGAPDLLCRPCNFRIVGRRPLRPSRPAKRSLFAGVTLALLALTALVVALLA